MLGNLVGLCLRRPWLVVLTTIILTAGGLYFSVERFAIDTDTSHLFSSSIAWRQNEQKLYKEFPDLNELILVVVDGSTPAQTEDAAKRLSEALAGKPTLLRVWRPEDHKFFRDNGLLYLDPKEVKRLTATVVAQRDILQTLAEDQSLRGLATGLLDNLREIGGSQRGMEQFAVGVNQISEALEATIMGEPARVDWGKLLSIEPPETPGATDLQRIILVKPELDYTELQPAAKPLALVRETAAALGLTQEHGLKVRLTGQAALSDDEYSTITHDMDWNIALTIGVVTLILFAALRSPKLIIAVLATLLAGLAITAGLGILLIGRFNMISVAFAALFIGLGVDFGIQFTTRYREERHKGLSAAEGGDAPGALVRAANGIGGSLTLAAVSLLAGFFCFLPTDFKGVAELGLIAGLGMIIAYLATLTFLPAAIRLLNPRAEKLPVKTAALAPVDHWILRHRALVILVTLAITAAGAPFLMRLGFDSNPMDLRSQRVESVKTFLDLSKNPRTALNTIEILEPSLEKAQETAARLAELPEVDHVTDVETLLPKDQDAKLPLAENAAYQLRRVFSPKLKAPPTDEENRRALMGAVVALQRAGAQKAPPAITRFKEALEALVQSDAPTRARAQAAVFSGFTPMIEDLRRALSVKKIAAANLPEDLLRDWVSKSGVYRVEASPKGDSNDLTVMKNFGDAVQKVAPEASGGPIIVVEAGKTIVRAFALAGLYAFVAIFLILALALRNPKDVALTLGPLLLAGVLSLETADLAGMSLNFANIIALPLMFAVGVAFHIYYVIAWRKGVVDMLASSLTRAIFFSALTTGTAFGSLVFSSHPGTASMGELLAISLVYTLLAAFFVVPAFLGPPRQTAAPARLPLEGSSLDG